MKMIGKNVFTVGDSNGNTLASIVSAVVLLVIIIGFYVLDTYIL